MVKEAGVPSWHSKNVSRMMRETAFHWMKIICIRITLSKRSSELAFIAVALDVQHASGGSLASVLDAARESVEGEIELERSLRVQTAQADRKSVV